MEPTQEHSKTYVAFDENEDRVLSKRFLNEPEASTFDSIEEKAQELFEQNLVLQAESLLKALHMKGLGTCRSHSLLGACYHQRNLFKKALDSYKKALEISPSDLETNINLTFLRLDLGDYSKGYRQYKQALQSHLQNRESEWKRALAEQHYKCGMQYYQKGFHHEALLEFLKVVPVFKDSISLELLIIRCLWNLKQKKRAFQKLYSMQKNYPHSTEVFLLLGDFFFDTKKTTLAIFQWEHVLKLDPQNKEALDRLSKIQDIQSVEEEVPFA